MQLINKNTMATPPPLTAAQERELHNMRIAEQNRHVYGNYQLLLRHKNEIDELATAIRTQSNKVRAAVVQSASATAALSNIKTIKSQHNGAMLAVQPITESDMYQVIINGQCLSIYNSSSLMLKNCQQGNAISDSQQFHTIRILTPLHAESIMPPHTPARYSQVTYPYNIFKSAMTNECMSLTDSGDVIMQACNPNNLRQQWKISPNALICND
jgi:hypothetical protein